MAQVPSAGLEALAHRHEAEVRRWVSAEMRKNRKVPEADEVIGFLISKKFNPLEARGSHGKWIKIALGDEADQEINKLPPNEAKRVRRHLQDAREALDADAPTAAYKHLYDSLTSPQVEHSENLMNRMTSAWRAASEHADGRSNTSNPLTLGDPQRMTSNSGESFGKLSRIEKYILKNYELPENGGADYWNPALRGTDDRRLASVQGDIKIMDGAIAKSWARNNMILYRGMSAPEGFKFMPGMKFTDKAFGSTTENENLARNFAYMRAGQIQPAVNVNDVLNQLKTYPGTPTLMKISVPAGYNMTNGDASVEEHILPRGTQYQVTSIDPDGTVNLQVVA